MKTKWNLIETGFGDDEGYAVAGVDSQYCYWNREIIDETRPTFYFDRRIYKIRKRPGAKKKSFGFLLESKAIIPDVYQDAHRVINRFNLFFTHNSILLKYSNARWIPGGGVWIGGKYGLGKICIHKKSKLVSMVSSKKNMCPMHLFRLQAFEIVGRNPKVEILGSAATGWISINQSLEDFMFSIVIENYIDDLYFTEKINNCFATGTIPIYYGARHIAKIYNPAGIVTFTSIDELYNILNQLSDKDYYNRINAVKENHEKCKQFISIEDYIYTNYFNESGNLKSTKKSIVLLTDFIDYLRITKATFFNRCKKIFLKMFLNGQIGIN